MHDQFDIDLVGPAFRIDVLVDKGQGVFRHFWIFSIDVVEHLYLPLPFGRSPPDPGSEAKPSSCEGAR